MDYQDELTEKRRSALWRQLHDNRLPQRYPTPQETRRAKRIAFWMEFAGGVAAGILILGLAVLAMFAL